MTTEDKQRTIPAARAAEEGTGPTAGQAAQAAEDAFAAGGSAEGVAGITGLLQRVSKMASRLLQDSATLLQTQAALAQTIPEGFSRLHTTFAMVAKQLATREVKLEEGHLETRRLVTGEIEALSQRIQGELLHRAVERLLDAGLVEVIDDIDVGLAQMPTEQQASPAYQALRLVRDKLLGALRRLGIEQAVIEPGMTRFDELMHQCQELVGGTVTEKATIDHIYKHGYLLRGQIIRRAQVVVRGA